MTPAETVFLCVSVTALGIFMLPLPLRCERRWCFRPQVGVSIYCRRHTDEILRGGRVTSPLTPERVAELRRLHAAVTDAPSKGYRVVAENALSEMLCAQASALLDAAEERDRLRQTVRACVRDYNATRKPDEAQLGEGGLILAMAELLEARADRDALLTAADAFRQFVANPVDNGIGEIEARNALFATVRRIREKEETQ